MIKVKLYKTEVAPFTTLESYSIITRIPFSVRIGSDKEYQGIISGRNSDWQDNFIEFEFSSDDKILTKICCVNINEDTVLDEDLSWVYSLKNDYFICTINEEESLLDGEIPSVVWRSADAICMIWTLHKQQKIEYFAVGEGCFIGLDEDCFIRAVLVTGLNKETIFDIFGS